MPIELKHPKKGLINTKNNDQKCFLWCHVRHINPLKEHPERITKIDKEIACNLNYDNVFGYENQLIFPIFLIKKLKTL